jgi:hypothetical protein
LVDKFNSNGDKLRLSEIILFLMKRRLIKIGIWFFGTLFSLMLIITILLYIFKDEICGYAVQELNKHLKTPVTVSEVDLTFWRTFPNLSIDFNKVFIKDALPQATKNDTLLCTEQIRFKFNPIDIWYEDYKVQSVEIQPGTLKFKVNEKGEVNYDILKETSDTSSSNLSFKLENVYFENFNLSYENDATKQYYQTHLNELNFSGDFSKETTTITAKSDLQLKNIQSGKVNLISDKPATLNLDINIDSKKGTVQIPTANILISNLPFQFKGMVDTSKMNFELHSKDIQLTDLANNFSLKQMDNINQFKGSGKVFFDLLINGELNHEEPTKVDCSFGVNQGILTEPKNNITLKNINLKGEYSNKEGPEKEFLELSNLNFTSVGGPFEGNLNITEFNSPVIKGKAKGHLNLDIMHALLKIPMVESLTGSATVNSDFHTKVIYLSDESSNLEIKKCEGEVQLKKVNLKLTDDKRTFSEMSGTVYLRGDEAGITDGKLKLGQSDLAIQGIFKNIFQYFGGKGNLDADIDLNSLNIDVEDLGTTSKQEKVEDGRQFVLPNDIEGNLNLKIGNLSYGLHGYNQITGKLNVKGRKLTFENLSLTNAETKVNGSLIIAENNPELFNISTYLTSDNIKFKPLFKEWNSFQQDVIKADNISGTASANLTFEAPFDYRKGIISSLIKAKVYMKITDGRLKNVEAFKSITKSLSSSTTVKALIGQDKIGIFENKLLDLKFETLENTFTIQNGKLEIPAMLVQSSAMDVTVSGTHTFENIVDYKFGFNLRDITKVEKNEYGTIIDDGTGIKMFMRMYGNINNPTIVWDKQSKKDQLKEDIEKEKETLKSILKTELGLFGKDSTVQVYKQESKQKEIISIDFEEDEPDKSQNKETQKDKKNKKLQKWKSEAESEKKETIKFD